MLEKVVDKIICSETLWTPFVRYARFNDSWCGFEKEDYFSGLVNRALFYFAMIIE